MRVSGCVPMREKLIDWGFIMGEACMLLHVSDREESRQTCDPIDLASSKLVWDSGFGYSIPSSVALPSARGGKVCEAEWQTDHTRENLFQKGITMLGI